MVPYICGVLIVNPSVELKVNVFVRNAKQLQRRVKGIWLPHPGRVVVIPNCFHFILILLTTWVLP